MASIYLHIPFCERKCIYCDFYSVTDHQVIDDFIVAMCDEIDMCVDYGGREQYETIYFGGGTPSLLRPEQIGKILNRLRRTFSIKPDAEITLEVNPGTVDRGKLTALQQLGVNRLSIGVQSFFDDELQLLTRIHSAAQGIQTIALAKEIGFKNISIDLIYALPKQTVLRWEETLRRAIAFEPEHISAYSLIIEGGTPLESKIKLKEMKPTPLELEAEMYTLAMEILNDTGYEHYEVSNYAEAGYCSKHNCNYWNHSNYIGIGPSAHSFWSIKRWWNVSDLRTYINQIMLKHLPIAGSELLTPEQLLDEAVMLGLRTGKLNLQQVREEHGIDFLESSHSLIEQLISNKLVILNEQILTLTNKGFLICDEISERILASIAVR